MTVGIVGSGPAVAVRRHAADAAPYVDHIAELDTGRDLLPGDFTTDPDVLDAFLETVDAVLLSVPSALHVHIAEAAVRRGVALFLEWPPAPSLAEAEAIAKLAEEASVEVAVSRPWRFLPVLDRISAASRTHLVLLNITLGPIGQPTAPKHLADALDLCQFLAGSNSIQRIDAEVARSQSRIPNAAAFALRFHNGAYAQVSLRATDEPAGGHLFVAGPGFQEHVTLSAGLLGQVEPSSASDLHALWTTETTAFLSAVNTRRFADFSIQDGVHTLRLMERLMARLR
ncbi:MAG: Gfo/Idh/MocA family oxidoreductase [Bacteroidota bacterium]